MSEKPPEYEHFEHFDDSWEPFKQYDILDPKETLDKIYKSIVKKQPVDLTSISKNQGVHTIRVNFSGLYRIDEPLVETLDISPQVQIVGTIVGETSTAEVSDKNGESITVTFTVDQDGNPTDGRFFVPFSF